MSSYADNAPIIVDRARATRSSTSTAAATSTRSRRCGSHARPRGPRARRRAPRPARPRRAHDDARQRQPGRRRARRGARAGVVPVDEPHFLFASDGAAAVEQALKIAFQYWVNRGVDGPHDVPRVRRRVPRRHDRRALGRRRRLRHRPVRPAALPRAARARRSPTRLLRRPRAGWSPSTPRELAAVIVEPLVQGAAGHAARAPDGPRRAGRGVPRARRAADLRRGRDRLRPHRHAVRVASRPGSGPTCSASARG